MESTFIILTQIITFGTAWSMFHCVLKRKKKDWFSLVGALGYLLLPYHVYVVTESVDRSQILIWMVVPILTASLIKMSDTEKMFWKTGYGLTAVLALGIIGRLDGVAALTLLFLICVGGICRRQWQYPVIGILGVAMAYPTYMTWKHWLFDGSFAESGLEYTSIMEQGYSIGGLFSTYFYRNGHPGMGILLLGCLLFLLYQSFVKGKKICAKNDHIWLGDGHQIQHFVFSDPMVFIHEFLLHQRNDDITAPERECTQIQCGYEYFPQYFSLGFFFFPTFHATFLHSF